MKPVNQCLRQRIVFDELLIMKLIKRNNVLKPYQLLKILRKKYYNLSISVVYSRVRSMENKGLLQCKNKSARKVEGASYILTGKGEMLCQQSEILLKNI